MKIIWYLAAYENDFFPEIYSFIFCYKTAKKKKKDIESNQQNLSQLQTMTPRYL